VRAGSRNRTFLIATSCNGQQVRMSLGRWPLLSVEEARSRAADILRGCRAGVVPVVGQARQLPTLEGAIEAYATAKAIKPGSLKRYQSILRTHFGDWWLKSVATLAEPLFAQRCHDFAQSKGAALVEVGRGLIGALLKYLNAVHGLKVENPFHRLADAGLLPDRPKPRARKLQEADMPGWRAAVDALPHLQHDYLMTLVLTGLRRNEGTGITPEHVDWNRMVVVFPDTKNGRPHTLPITSRMEPILRRRCEGAEPSKSIFAGVSAEHVAEMAVRQGAPEFMLHDLRKLVATTGERLQIGDALLRRILNHVAKKSDTLYRHYVSLSEDDIREPLERIQAALDGLMIGR
jgi:integrase